MDPQSSIVTVIGLYRPEEGPSIFIDGFNLDRFLANGRAAVPDDRLPVVGNPNSWFVFKDRAFFATDYGPDSLEALGLEAFYLVENNAFRKETRYEALNQDIRDKYELVRLTEFSEDKDEFRVFKCVRKRRHQGV